MPVVPIFHEFVLPAKIGTWKRKMKQRSKEPSPSVVLVIVIKLIINVNWSFHILGNLHRDNFQTQNKSMKRIKKIQTRVSNHLNFITSNKKKKKGKVWPCLQSKDGMMWYAAGWTICIMDWTAQCQTCYTSIYFIPC